VAFVTSGYGFAGPINSCFDDITGAKTALIDVDSEACSVALLRH
jgi:hypothetical protein